MRAELLLSAWLLLALRACISAFSLSDRTADVESTDAYTTKAPSPGQATVVRTAKEFSDAVRAGHPHIELQGHVFFTAPTLNYLGIVPDTVQSIRVRYILLYCPLSAGILWFRCTLHLLLM